MESNRYQNGKIYKIVDNGYNKCYIGSTIEALSVRMAKHRSGYRNYLNGGDTRSFKVWDIFDEFGMENCKIELVEEYPCENKIQLQKRECFHIQNINCVNKRVEGRTAQEYREVHKERIKEQQHEYWVNNKEKLTEHKSERFVCDICQGCYTRDHRSHHVKTLKHQSAMPQD